MTEAFFITALRLIISSMLYSSTVPITSLVSFVSKHVLHLVRLTRDLLMYESLHLLLQFDLKDYKGYKTPRRAAEEKSRIVGGVQVLHS